MWRFDPRPTLNLADVPPLRLPVQGLPHESLLGAEAVLEGQASETREGQDRRRGSASEAAGERRPGALCTSARHLGNTCRGSVFRSRSSAVIEATTPSGLTP